MRGFGLYAHLVLWDLRRELRRKDVVINMVLFGILVLFLVNLGLDPMFARLRSAAGSGFLSAMDPEFLGRLDERVGAVCFWIAVLFAGTVGLGQSLAAEREGGALTGLLLAPIDLGIFYLAKVTATWIYVLVMEACLIAGYVILFHFDDWRVLGPMFVSLAFFSLGYMALGVVLAAMTTALRTGGEVVLRILLFPLLLPMIYLTLQVSEATFGVHVPANAFGPPPDFGSFLAVVAAVDALYLVSGYLVFPKIFEE